MTTRTIACGKAEANNEHSVQKLTQLANVEVGENIDKVGLPMRGEQANHLDVAVMNHAKVFER